MRTRTAGAGLRAQLDLVRLELALRSAKLIVWVWDMATDLFEMTDEDRAYAGLALDHVRAAQTFAMMHPDDLAPTMGYVARVKAGEAHVPIEFRLPDGRGGWRWWVGQASRFGAGEMPFIVGVCYDDTQRRAHEQALADSENAARQAAEDKARFLATMSHEIRTPMNGVVGMIELLAHTALDGEQRRMIDTCRDSALVLLSLLNDVLDYSKIEAGHLDLEATRLSPRRLVEQVGAVLGAQATPRGIDVDVQVEADVPSRAIGDRVRLRQILANLGGNAVKFTERGRVLLRVAVERRDETHTHLRFDVHDTGIGIADEVVPHLFQPFRQADASTTRRFGGTGLGLSIVGHLVALMEGRVECESRAGEGSRFSVVVPLAHADVPDARAAAPTHAIVFAADARRRALLRDVLLDLQVDVATAADGDELAARLSETPRDTPSVVVVDKRTPLAGQLLAGLPTTPSLGGVPVILVRGLEGSASAPHLVQVEGNPLTRANLRDAIEAALGRTQPRATPAPTPLVPQLEPDVAAQLGRLVLLADDHPVNRDVIAQQLQQLGYGCVTVGDGEHAWSLVRDARVRYCLLLTDCHMPALDGFALTARVRAAEAEGRWPHLPIVAITASATQGEGERCLAAGMDGFLAKPVQMEDMRAMLATTLPPIAGYDTLARLVQGDRDRLRRILGSYVLDTRSDLDRWRLAESTGDRDALQRLAHKLKSGCVQVGARDAAQAMEVVERDAPDSRVPRAVLDAAVARARVRVEAIVADIERALGGLSSAA
ncbi:Signal transduction histidine kinase [Lysobacter dokdonensis DS-58]|uniref:histidine kinase n=1 Tax=Lysobacter dokdonensis DS-58 TaxID=1300345 RepID=A0A0A2WJG2_9GAMM|nr:Signal transduction histidine kinase [Lysobacter dokdonensis DS-58]